MTFRSIGSSPKIYARIAGLLYLIIIVLGAAGEMVIRGGIVVPGDAMATAANLRAMESLWRLGIAFELFLGICTITQAWIFYYLLRPVSKELALLATLFNLVAIAVEITYSLQLAEALFPLADAAYLKAFSPEQLYAIAMMSIKAHSIGFGIALFFFGPFFLIAGYLLFKSDYFPKTIGIIYLIPGLSYLTSSFALILAPSFANRFYFVIASPAALGELAFCLWLIVKGINVQKWKEKTGILPEDSL